MKSIIVTVSDRHRHFVYDMDVPTDEVGGKVTEDIFEVLNEKDPELRLSTYYYSLFLNRQNRMLDPRETLADAGVWNGDDITVVSGRREEPRWS